MGDRITSGPLCNNENELTTALDNKDEPHKHNA